MAQQISFGSLFGSSTAPQPAAVERSDDQPFRILVLGDFSGRAGVLASDRPTAVDRDNIDELLEKVRPTIALPGVHPDGSEVSLEITGWDDFHPDQIYNRLPLFETLRVTRNRLKNPKTFDEAAEEVRRWAAAAEKSQAESASAESDPAPESASQSGDEPGQTGGPRPASGAEWLEQLVGGDGGEPERVVPTRKPDIFQQLLSKIAEPHRLAPDDPRLKEMLAAVDDLSADRMRAVLHHPNFQAVESAWRSLELLTKRLETGRDLKLSMLDRSKRALAAELSDVEQINRSALFKTLTDLPPGAAPWTLVVGNYQFGSGEADVLLLGAMAQIAARAGAPFVAGADPLLFGCASLDKTPDPDDWRQPRGAPAELWQALRQFPEATSLGLVAPRFLLRLPYGRDSSPTERFAFEELPAPNHDGYLWGNSAFVVACLLGQTFSETGWKMAGRLYRDLDNLPTHIYRNDDGESQLKPCAEALLVDRAVDRILESGVMSLQSFADRGAVRLPRMQSIATPTAPLAGRWE